MSRILNKTKYPIKEVVVSSDYMIGSDSQNNGKTVSFEIDKIAQYVAVNFPGLTTYQPDEEDITSVNLKLKFKDRDPDGAQLGYHIIRNDFDWLNIPPNFADSIWEIRYEFDLVNSAVTLPDNVCLYYNGGFITNYLSITAVNGKSTVNEAEGFDGSGTIDPTWSFGERFTTVDLNLLNKLNISGPSLLLGRGDSGSGEVEEITLGPGLTMTANQLSSPDASSFFVTIGVSGADYATFNEAFIAGARYIIAITDVTEVVSTTINDDVSLVVLNDITVDFGPYQILSSVDTIFEKTGEGEIRYASTTASKSFFDQQSSSCVFIYNGGIFTNDSTANNCLVTNTDFVKVNSCTINLPNANDGGFYLYYDNSYLRNVKFIANAGGNTNRAFRSDIGTIENVQFHGTFLNEMFFPSNFTGPINNIYVQDSGNKIFSDITCKLQNIYGSNDNVYDIELEDNTNILQNIFQCKDVIFIGDNNQFENLISVNFVTTTLTEKHNFKNIYFSSSQFLNVEKSILESFIFQNASNDFTLLGGENLCDKITLTSGKIRLYGDSNNLTNSSATSIIIGADQVDATLPPPTENEGDRYYLVGNPVHPNWDGALELTTPEFSSGSWGGDFTPNNTTCSANKTDSGVIIDNGNNSIVSLTNIR